MTVTTVTRHKLVYDIAPESRRPFTVADYHAMAETGIFSPDERTELIDGEIVTMAPIGPTHGWVGDQLLDHVGIPARSAGYKVRFGAPISLSPLSEPQPDFYVCKDREHGYQTTHPTPEDIVLLVEIADTSIRFDRNVKSLLYAAAGIPEYWIIDIKNRRIIVFTRPDASGYLSTREYLPGETITSSLLPNLQVSVNSVLPQE